MRTSDNGISLIKEYEGYYAKVYLCPAGKPTIGYGHVVMAGEAFSKPLSEREATDLLLKDLPKYEAPVLAMVDAPLTQNQFDALVSFVYNLGPNNLKNSTLLRKLNAEDYDGAAHEFEKWVNCNGKPLAGLVRRRKAERALFETKE